MDQATKQHSYIGDLVKDGFYDKLVIIGYPYDEGAKKCGVKLGQDLGPDSFRRFLVDIGAVVNSEYDFIDISKGLPSISDYGNIQILPKTEQQLLLEKLQTKVSACIKRGNIPFVVGGTRDLSFAVSKSVIQENQKSLMILFRNELDLDENKNQSITQKNSLKYILSQIQPNTKIVLITSSFNQGIPFHENIEILNPSSLSDSSDDIKTNIYQARTPVGLFIQKLIQKANIDDATEQVYISISMESIQFIPGVSSKFTQGITCEEAVEVCKVAAYTSKKLVAFDVPDYNPFIEDQNTGRLLATMFYYFALGLSARLQQLSQ